ncbi:hypothetical protein [uncultured Kordia sp.]|uniref:hypothetical protein n=1 Tax=uncultured Kordia sp. TaxID=507699 RepID=UPI0026395815|nr:hypothetical protein [uncultured Kordia sp.]
MNSRLLLYVFVIATFFACGAEEKKADTTTSQTKEKETVDTPEKILSLDDKIKLIKTNFSTIENQLSSFDKKEIEENVGGGVLKKEAYFKSGVPQKVKEGNYGEHGSIERTFYLHNNILFFVFEQERSEAGMHGPFTSKEKRYYIHDGKLIRVLAKEKTSKSYEIDMSTVKNIDVTEQWKSEQNMISEFEKTLRETSASLLESETETVGLSNGRWISTDDPNSGVEIKDGTFTMFYKGTETNPNSIYKYTLTEKDGVEYLNLKNDAGEEMIYGLLEYSDESMVLSYLNRGSTLTYRKEK